MDETEARQRLERMVAASSEPTLEVAEVDDLLASARRADPLGNPPSNVPAAPAWQPSTPYVYGAVVTASPAAGRWWRCVVPGATAATQPLWPAYTPYSVTGGRLLDGTVTWEDAGSAWSPTWDLNAAVADGWELKAGKAAGRFDFTTDGQTFNRGQIIAHCNQQARVYRRKVVGNAPTG